MTSHQTPHSVLTRHAKVRCSQRGIRREQVEYVIRHGKRYHHGGGTWYFLRKRDIHPDDIRRFAKSSGLAVMVDESTMEVITVFHVRRPMWWKPVK